MSSQEGFRMLQALKSVYLSLVYPQTLIKNAVHQHFVGAHTTKNVFRGDRYPNVIYQGNFLFQWYISHEETY